MNRDPVAAPVGRLGKKSTIEEALLLTVPQAAQALDIGTTLAYELIGQNKLPHVRLGRAVRVPRAALEAWIAKNTRPTP